MTVSARRNHEIVSGGAKGIDSCAREYASANGLKLTEFLPEYNRYGRGAPLKQIQDWLGHSNFSTTANIYAHLDYSSKLSSAQAMVSGMPLPEAGDFGSRWEQSAEKSGE